MFKKIISNLLLMILFLIIISGSAYLNRSSKEINPDYKSLEAEINYILDNTEINSEINSKNLVDEKESDLINQNQRGEYDNLLSNPFVSPIEEQLSEKIEIKKEKIRKQREIEEAKRREEQRRQARLEEESGEEKDEKEEKNISRPDIKIQAIIGNDDNRKAIIHDFNKTFIANEGDIIRSIKFIKITSDFIEVEYEGQRFKY